LAAGPNEIRTLMRAVCGSRHGIEVAPCTQFRPCSQKVLSPAQVVMLATAEEVASPAALVVRPGLEALRRYPTLCAIDESWGKIELKLETEDTRYWLTTEGAPERSRQVPANYVINFVTVEKRTREGRWDLSAVFSPEAWKLSQAFDYCQLLYRELRALNEKLEAQFSWELQRQLDAIRKEIEDANQVIRSLSQQVRARSA
jgi:hypothetical protein